MKWATHLRQCSWRTSSEMVLSCRLDLLYMRSCRSCQHYLTPLVVISRSFVTNCKKDPGEIAGTSPVIVMVPSKCECTKDTSLGSCHPPRCGLSLHRSEVKENSSNNLIWTAPVTGRTAGPESSSENQYPIKVYSALEKSRFCASVAVTASVN